MPTTLIQLPETRSTIENCVQQQQVDFINSLNSYKRQLATIQQDIHKTSVIANHRISENTPLSQQAAERSQEAVRLVLVSLESQQANIISLINSMELINALLGELSQADLMERHSNEAKIQANQSNRAIA